MTVIRPSAGQQQAPSKHWLARVGTPHASGAGPTAQPCGTPARISHPAAAAASGTVTSASGRAVWPVTAASTPRKVQVASRPSDTRSHAING
jgi:hypothetical protein